MSLIIEKISDAKSIKQFIDFPHELYKEDKNYVPELYMAQKDMFDQKKNPFFLHSSVELFLAKREGKIVGRVAAVKNNNYNEYHESNVGFFGFFDTVNDQEVSNLLLDTVIKVHQDHGFESIIGPTNFSTNDTAGTLVDGYDSPPVILMTYNFPYYKTLLENYGFGKEMDILAFKIPTKTVSDKSVKLADLLEARLLKKNIKIRHFNKKNFKTEVAKITKIYNQAWEKNWGFVPSTEAEAKHMADDLKMVIDSRYTFLAEVDDKPVGMLLALPNINEITIDFKKGRLLPFNLFKLLMRKSKVRSVRIIIMGVVEEYRQMGIEGALYAKIIKAARNHNIDYGEASWILENNEMMNKGIEKLNGEYYKRYRLFSKKIK